MAQRLPAGIGVSRIATAAGEGSERDDHEGVRCRWDDPSGSSSGGLRRFRARRAPAARRSGGSDDHSGSGGGFRDE